MTRRRWLAVLGVGAAVAGGLFFFLPERCPKPDEKLKGVWDADRKFALQKAFAAKRDALLAAEGALDAFATAWSADWTKACEGPPEVRVCLDRQLAEFGALAEVLGRPDEAGQATAPLSLERLAAREGCAPGTRVPPPKGKVARAEVAAAQKKIARADALRRIGKAVEALEEANAATVLAQSAGDPSTLAEALLAKAELYRMTGKAGAADAALTEALAAANQGKDVPTAIRIAIVRIAMLTAQPQKTAEADGWISQAEALKPSPAWQAELDLAVAALRLEQQRPAQAESRARGARTHFERQKQWARRLDATGLLAQALTVQGKLEEAASLFQEALDGRAAMLGPAHPLVLRTRVFLAQSLLAAFRDADALKALAPIDETTLQQMPAASGGAVLCARSVAHTRLGLAEGHDEAKRCIARTPESTEEAALAHDALAAAWRLQREDRKALGENEAAVSIFGQARSPAAGRAISGLAVTQLQLGDAKTARATAFRALKLFDAVPPEHAIDPCPALWAAAEAARRLKAPTAIPEARTALGCLGDHPGRIAERARAAPTLARALGTSPDAILSFQQAAKDPSPVQLEALDALAALRPKAPEAACAAAVEALVRAPTEAREKAAKGCKLPRIH